MEFPDLVVSVKNTFLDFVETPAAPDLARGKTEPSRALSPDGGDVEHDEVETPPTSCRYVTGDFFDPDLEWDAETHDEVVPPPTLCRYVTGDFFDPDLEWDAEKHDEAVPPPTLCRYVTEDFFDPDLEWDAEEHDEAVPPPTLCRYVTDEWNWASPQTDPAPAPAPAPVVGLMYQMVPVCPVAFSPQQLPAPCIPSADLRGAQAPLVASAALTGERVPEQLPVPGLDRHFSANSQLFRIHWTFPDKQLRSSNKVAVSPPFELRGAKWKLLLSPVVQHTQRCGGSFKGARGKAVIKLKCEDLPSDTPPTLMFRFFAGKGPPRGPGSHDFSQSTVGTIPSNEVWDLTQHVQKGTVTIGAEIWLV